MGLGQGRSIDTTGGWKNHFARVTRWKNKSLQALEISQAADFHAVVDVVLAYFVWAHSLRDWLIKANQVERETLDRVLSLYPCWKICRDIANRCRHYDLTHNPSDKHWSITREYDMWAEPEARAERVLLLLVFGDERYAISDVIHATFDMWVEVLRSLEGEGFEEEVAKRWPQR